MHTLDVIIPTYNNYEYLAPCLQSIVSQNVTHGMTHVTVINNGHKDSCDWIKNDMVTVVTPGKNLGWEGGIKLGLEKTKAPFVMFLNDDTFLPVNQRLWVNRLLQHFIDPKVGAVGPSSNVVMGLQNIFQNITPTIFEVKYLIGFCMLVKREAVEKAGGIDTSLPGGDDLDLSIRLRQAGYKLIVDRDVFLYHHGFKTGNRIYGDVQKMNGWNSYEMLEKTNHALIKKHGFRVWSETMQGGIIGNTVGESSSQDTEGDIIRKHIKGEVVLDLGCAGNKTIPTAIGVDMVPKDEAVETLTGQVSQADVVADVSQPLPFDDESADTIIMRHILEHIMDFVPVLKGLRSLLKEKGRLIIAVPNNGRLLSIPMNIEHVHGFDPQSMKNIVELCGFKMIDQMDGGNGISFISIFEKA